MPSSWNAHVVDILRYLGDDVNHKPSERDEAFGDRYKVDYLNNDALRTRIGVRDGRLVLPDGMSYGVLWIPEGTFLLPETECVFSDLARQGARIVRGDFAPDWASPLVRIGRDARDGLFWYARREGSQESFFVAEPSGKTFFEYPLSLSPVEEYSAGATSRVYRATFAVKEHQKGRRTAVSLGKVRSWATVRVNGVDAGRLWHAPYEVDVSELLKVGDNQIEVVVTSTWHNRLVEDAGKPEDERRTWTLYGPKAGVPFAEAGLLGPAKIVIEP